MEVLKEIQLEKEIITEIYDNISNILISAKEDMKKKDIENCYFKLKSVREILYALMLSLNLDESEIAKRLFPLYFYLYKRVIEANLTKNQEIIDEVVSIIKTLREGYSIIIN